MAAATRWVWQDYSPAQKKEVLVGISPEVAPNENRQKNGEMFEKHQHWLDEKRILEAARNAEGALRIAARYMNVERLYDSNDHFGSFATFRVTSESGESQYTVRVTLKPSNWVNAA